MPFKLKHAMTQLHIDIEDRSPTEPIWTFGGNAGRLAALPRADVRRQLRATQDELGFRYIGCRGLLDPEMDVLQADGGFHFERLEAALDWLMQNGLQPFIELPGGFGTEAGESDDDRWQAFIAGLTTHLYGRFGCDMRQWYFLMPDPAAGRMGDEPLRRFDLTVRAIKQIDPEFRIGLSISDAASLDRLLDHLGPPAEEASPDHLQCDFIGVDASAIAASELHGMLLAARRTITERRGADVQLICIGWNRSAVAAPMCTDECGYAAVVAEQLARLADVCQGALLGDISDISSQAGAGHEPFHSGPGLLTVNDIPKASFNAYRLLREHAGYHTERLHAWWIEPVEGLGCMATREEFTLRLLIWYRRDAKALRDGAARFTIEGLPDSVTQAQIQVIRPGAGSAYEGWLDLGKPQFVNRAILELLEVASQPAMAEVDFREYPPRLEPGMVMQLTMQLPFEDVTA